MKSLSYLLLSTLGTRAFAFTLWPRAAPTYPDPIPCTGEACTSHTVAYQDATIIRRRSDGRYFRISRATDPGQGMRFATAPSLRGEWNQSSYQIFNASVPLKVVAEQNLDRRATHLWAPEVHYIKGTYYLYYGIETPRPGTKLGAFFDVAVATSKTLEFDSWVDRGSIGIPQMHSNYSSLGFNLVVNSTDTSGEDPTRHISFGSYNYGIYGLALTGSHLNVSQQSIDSGPHLLIKDQPRPFVKNGPLHNEGSFQLRHENWVYLFYSQGGCCPNATGGGEFYQPGSEYRILVCRAKSPSGPYFDRSNKPCAGVMNNSGTVVLASHSNNQVYAPGGVGVINDPKEGLVLYYQYHVYGTTGKQSLGRFGFNHLSFDTDEWPVVVK